MLLMALEVFFGVLIPELAWLFPNQGLEVEEQLVLSDYSCTNIWAYAYSCIFRPKYLFGAVGLDNISSLLSRLEQCNRSNIFLVQIATTSELWTSLVEPKTKCFNKKLDISEKKIEIFPFLCFLVMRGKIFMD